MNSNLKIMVCIIAISFAIGFVPTFIQAVLAYWIGAS